MYCFDASFLSVMAAYFRAKVKAFAAMIDKYVEDNKPGVIVLPNGQKKTYDPTIEEEEALEDLVQVLTSVF
jgi:hypothetical protein